MDNSFSDFETTSSGRRAATLLRAHAVKPKQIFDAVLFEVKAAIPRLTVSGKYTTEQLCDPVLWSSWLTAERRVAGMCLTYVVRRNMVALVPHETRSGKGKKRYRLPVVQENGESKPARNLSIPSVGFVFQPA